MLSSAQAFGFEKEIPRYMTECNVLLSRTLRRQNILFAILRVQQLVINPHWLLDSVIIVIHSRAVNTIWVITKKSCLYSTKLWPTVGSHKFSEIFLKLTSWTEISVWHDYNLGPCKSWKIWCEDQILQEHIPVYCFSL